MASWILEINWVKLHTKDDKSHLPHSPRSFKFWLLSIARVYRKNVIYGGPQGLKLSCTSIFRDFLFFVLYFQEKLFFILYFWSILYSVFFWFCNSVFSIFTIFISSFFIFINPYFLFSFFLLYIWCIDRKVFARGTWILNSFCDMLIDSDINSN